MIQIRSSSFGRSKVELTCSFQLHSPKGTVMYTDTDCICGGALCPDGLLVLADKATGVKHDLCRMASQDFYRLVVTSDNLASYTLHFLANLGILTRGFNLTIRATAVGKSTRLPFPTTFTSQTSGYMTSVGYDAGLGYPVSVESWGSVHVPRDHGLMISFRQFNLGYSLPFDCLDLFITYSHNDSVEQVMHRCGTGIVPPSVYPSVRLLSLNMTSGSLSNGLGFKMLFSFHAVDALPRTLPGGLFNCSVDDYSAFQQHLDCNLARECVDGGDERGDCPFSSQACKGLVASGNKCFFFVDIVGHCDTNNGRLASITSRQELDALLPVWHYSGSVSKYMHIGLRRKWHNKPFMYRRMLRWTDKTLVYFLDVVKVTESVFGIDGTAICFIGYLDPALKVLRVVNANCVETTSTVENKDLFVNNALCEKAADSTFEDEHFKDSLAAADASFAGPTVQATPNATWTVSKVCSNTSTVSLVACPCGHVTHHFLSYDFLSHCGELSHSDECPVVSFSECESRVERWYSLNKPLHHPHTDNTSFQDAAEDNCRTKTSVCLSTLKSPRTQDSAVQVSVAMFVCSSDYRIHYTLLCDFRHDCPDKSDETFCLHPACHGFLCKNGQCVPKARRCDGFTHCLDDSDELGCKGSPTTTIPEILPGLIELDGTGGFVGLPYNHTDQCPDTHYRCPGQPSTCLPVYTRCNGYYDCIGREDEESCDDPRCPGYYRCRSSSVCVHLTHLCDGWPQCPHHDDEWLCHMTPCPRACVCQGLAFVCRAPFHLATFPNLRYLHLIRVHNVSLSDLVINTYLIYLRLVHCNISTLPEQVRLPNVQNLDLSNNKLTVIHMNQFLGLPNIKVLRLSQNPIVSLVGVSTDHEPHGLQVLDLSQTQLETFESRNISPFSQVKQLNLSYSKVHTIGRSGFHLTLELSGLDLRGCPLQQFALDVFDGATGLGVIHSPSYRLCCQKILPGQRLQPVCLSKEEGLSDCENLLRSRSHKVIFILLTVFSVLGNLACIVARYTRFKEQPPSSNNVFSLLVTNINMANLLAGFHTGVISVADEVYRGEYILNEETWTKGLMCKVVGSLHLLSNQTSLLTILLTSIHSFIALYFPFSKLRLDVTSSTALCVLIWILSAGTAAIPWIQNTLDEFYSQNGICFPLPVTKTDFPGHYFHFGIVIVMNIVVGLLVCVCQAFNLKSIKRVCSCNSEVTAAKVFVPRFLGIALANVACWTAVSAYSLAGKGSSALAQEEFNQILAVLIVPLPASLTPLLLILKLTQEAKRKKMEARLLTILKLRAAAEKRE